MHDKANDSRKKNGKDPAGATSSTEKRKLSGEGKQAQFS